MSRKTQIKNRLRAIPNSKKPFRTVPFENGFHFYTAIGNYTGITATNLSEFAQKLQKIPTESIIFHFKRQDFQNWIKYTIKDTELAERISKTNGEQSPEDLRREIRRTIETKATLSN